MSMTRGNFVTGLIAALPEASPLLAEHLDDQDGSLLIHLLVADVRRFLLDAWQRRDEDVLQRGLGFLDDALRTGDEAVENAVAVSFVEDIDGDDPDGAFVARWPTGLQAELRRQRNWSPERE